MKAAFTRLRKLKEKLARKPQPDPFTLLLEFMRHGRWPAGTKRKTTAHLWAERLASAVCGRPDPHPHLAHLASTTNTEN